MGNVVKGLEAATTPVYWQEVFDEGTRVSLFIYNTKQACKLLVAVFSVGFLPWVQDTSYVKGINPVAIISKARHNAVSALCGYMKIL